ncbi:hypothetical protein T265_01730 [Opisthorchis viverrini]|uniref:Helix-turn-helix domain-containing protein n=1 Tax=Opisthorchis viverrini TaxID=6198 RepID=A0A074ZXD0_OPIVI|nr:hypothetical protein T265_01730 [Opisthorchis viverrini]KER32108.1 hypothetical protein T265_01730 [Opisthorchis viverrini]
MLQPPNVSQQVGDLRRIDFRLSTAPAAMRHRFVSSSGPDMQIDVASQITRKILNTCFGWKTYVVTIESERNGQLSFLGVNVEEKADGTIERKIHRKQTWKGQYIHFDSFVPLQQKRNLIRCLTEIAMKICSPECLEEELKILERTFLQNGYPERFVLKTLEAVKPKTTEEKPVYMRLPSKGDSVAELITIRLRNSVDTTYLAANLRLSFNSSLTIVFCLKDRLPRSTTSFCVHSFVCSCRESYVGRTIRHLSDRIREHNPVSLSGSGKKPGPSAIAAHLTEIRHVIDKEQAFTIIYRAPLNGSRLVRSRLLSIAEAIGIRLLDSKLCIQKNLVRPLTAGFTILHPKETCATSELELAHETSGPTILSDIDVTELTP